MLIDLNENYITKQNNQFLQRGPDFMNYYRDIFLTRDLLPDIKQYSDYFTFQQDVAPAHRARETVELLKVDTPDFIPPNLWPPNSLEQPRSEPSRLQDLRRTARTGLQDKH